MPKVFLDSFTTDIVSGIDKHGRMVNFEFSPMFGPLFTNAEGEPLKRQPGIRSAAWAVFNEWFEARSSPA